ncbi:MAG: adenylate/guanylate cyclase domain-containing protein [Planctomycetaceae bacterium]
MLQLIAEGPDPRQRWRQALASDRAYRLGRSSDADLAVTWEPAMSRQHCLVRTGHDEVDLEVLPQARNPVFHRGEAIKTVRLSGGESFVIGRTRFIVAHADTDDSSGSDAPIEEVVVTRQQLQNVRYEDPDRRIDVLAKLSDVFGNAHGETERDSRLVSLILTGVRSAEAAAIIALDDHESMRIRSWERRRETAGAFRPSRRLVTDALGRKQTILHLWDPGASTPPSENDYTVSAEFDWAFCTPVRGNRGQRWGVYVAGQSPVHAGTTGRQTLQADIKFIELLAELIGSVDRQNRLEGDLSVLRQFLSPPILAALERAGDRESIAADLEPRECDVTVLFCDLRGFSQRSEESSGDLPGLLNRVSGALEIMTQSILQYGGVTGDFLGDASLGFWGWPFASEEAPLNACRAALAIRRAFQKARETPNHPLNDFEMGIGISHGRAVAGKIGTSDRVTVTVFGPVVNLASRLETMTKQLRVPILLDEATAALARARFPREEGRTRRLGTVQPFGMETTLQVSELLPSLSEFPELTDEHIARYEQGVDAFTAGRWSEAYRCLHDMPPSDQAQDFLTLRIAQNNRTPPPGWNGIIQLPNK